MEFRVLGPLEVVVGGRRVAITSKRSRALLAALLLGVTTFDDLVDAVWSLDVPAHPRAALQTCVTRLRNVLGARPPIESVGDGYRIVLDGAELDLRRFDAAVREARSAGDVAVEASLLREALALWRGDPLVDVQSEYLRRDLVPRLVERRLSALERCIELDLAAGRCDVPELLELTAAYPLRERFWAYIMTALHRSGRQTEALQAYADVRRRLVDDLGIEPGEDLRRAHQLVLSGDGPDEPEWVTDCQLPLDVADSSTEMRNSGS